MTLHLIASVDLPSRQSWWHFSVWGEPSQHGCTFTRQWCHSPRCHHRVGPWICVYWAPLWTCLRCWIQPTSMPITSRSSSSLHGMGPAPSNTSKTP